jgi:hypothetical protein
MGQLLVSTYVLVWHVLHSSPHIPTNNSLADLF